ncbi:MAG TPA: DUF2752 domain-containing protein [Syntrophorhabdaceae bacterium]
MKVREMESIDPGHGAFSSREEGAENYCLKKYLLPRKMAIAFLAGLGSISLLYLLGALPLLHAAMSSLSFCPFRLLTHLDCPGCGMTRSLMALASGDPWRAACLHPFSFFLIFVVCLSLMPAPWLRRAPRRTAGLLVGFYMATLVAVVVYWIVFKVLELQF